MSEKFKFLDHPSDLKIQAFGKDRTELFSNAALAMMTFLYPKQVEIKNHETKTEIRLQAKDSKALLVDFLSELLYLSDSNDVCYNQLHFKKLDETFLIATAYGRRVRAKEDIKAVTYHNLEIKKNPDGFEAMILFDL